ncbi:MAG: hypothetical protein Q9180_003958 [Flavoplaca navasiana]
MTTSPVSPGESLDLMQARLDLVATLLPTPPPRRRNPFGVIGDPPSLVRDYSSGSDADDSAPETPLASNEGNDTNHFLLPYYHYSYPGHLHAHPAAPTYYATDNGVPAFATSMPDIRGNDDHARLLQEAHMQMKHVQDLEEYSAAVSDLQEAQWAREEERRRVEEERRQAEEEEEEEERRRAAAAAVGRITWLKFEVNRARTLEERTAYQQELEMLLQAQKGR